MFEIIPAFIWYLMCSAALFVVGVWMIWTGIAGIVRVRQEVRRVRILSDRRESMNSGSLERKTRD